VILSPYEGTDHVEREGAEASDGAYDSDPRGSNGAASRGGIGVVGAATDHTLQDGGEGAGAQAGGRMEFTELSRYERRRWDVGMRASGGSSWKG